MIQNHADSGAGRLLANVTRGDRIESRHRGAVAVVRNGREVITLGDVSTPIFTRSSVKPLQALPLLERGGVERLSLVDAELAVMSASHDGTPAHVAAVRSLLAKGGRDEDDLLCGPHAPYHRGASLDIARSGGKPQRIHNNCSGKHAGFLHLAAQLGVPLEAYLDPESASQLLVRRAVAEMADLSPGDLDVAVDGCGAPTLAVPLGSLALAFFRLANPDGLADVRAAACRRLLRAITAEPLLLSGEDRICRALIASAPGRIYPKNGAEGVYAVGIVGADGEGYGLAIKVEDGAERGYLPVVVDLLRHLGLWDEVPTPLQRFAVLPVHNTQKRIVGHVENAVRWTP